VNARKAKSSKDFLREIHESVRSLASASYGNSAKSRNQIAGEIHEMLRDLRQLRNTIDPILSPPAVVDPTHPLLIGNFIGIALLSQARRPFNKLEKFYGSGVYAIYYKGRNKWYHALAGTQHPVYVGKSQPKDPMATEPRDQGTSLFGRLMQHASTIKSGRHISITDFSYRFLVIHSGWELSAEAFLVEMYKPAWNEVVTGFGNHTPGGGRRGKYIAAWDALHPGRSWAKSPQTKLIARRDQILEKLQKHFEDNRPFKTRDEIVKQFFRNLREWQARSPTS
jgi:hypothetical protein